MLAVRDKSRSESIKINVKVNIKINVKCDGQECPSHTFTIG